MIKHDESADESVDDDDDEVGSRFVGKQVAHVIVYRRK